METAQDLFTEGEYDQAVETIERIVQKVTGYKIENTSDYNSTIILIAHTLDKLDKAVMNVGKED